MDDKLIAAFPRPWRIEVNPFGGPPEGEAPNIFIVSADGHPVLIVAAHPAWQHMEERRLELAQAIVELANLRD